MIRYRLPRSVPGRKRPSSEESEPGLLVRCAVFERAELETSVGISEAGDSPFS
jgi:hypothetical protein